MDSVKLIQAWESIRVISFSVIIELYSMRQR